MQPMKETHERGILSIESDVKTLTDCDFGIQIAKDGRVWICINGKAFIRFKPIPKNIPKPPVGFWNKLKFLIKSLLCNPWE